MTQDRRTTTTSNAPSYKPKGHDVVLQRAYDNQSKMTVHTVTGKTIEGKLIARDRYTVSVKDGSSTVHTIFKSAIESFSVGA